MRQAEEALQESYCTVSLPAPLTSSVSESSTFPWREHAIAGLFSPINSDMSIKLLEYTTEVNADYLTTPAFEKFVKTRCHLGNQYASETEIDIGNEGDASSQVESEPTDASTSERKRNKPVIHIDVFNGHKKLISHMWHCVPSSPNPEESFSFDVDYNYLFQRHASSTEGSSASEICFTVDINCDENSGLADVAFSDIDTLELGSKVKPCSLHVTAHTRQNDANLSEVAFENPLWISDFETTVTQSGEISPNQDEIGQGLRTAPLSTIRTKIEVESVPNKLDTNANDLWGEDEIHPQPLSAPAGSYSRSITGSADPSKPLKRRDSRKRHATGGFFLKSPETGDFILIQ